MKKTFLIGVTAVAIAAGGYITSFAKEAPVSVLAASVPSSAKKHTKLGLYVTAAQAYELASKRADQVLFIDVRTRAEVNFLGMPTIADANIPYMEMNEWYAWDERKNEFKLEVNSHFAEAIGERLSKKGLGMNDQIVLMCRSGSRSAKAANLLSDLGYTKVYTITDGYEGDKAKEGPQQGQRVVNGWRNGNLPWSYKLDKEKMYLPRS